MRNAGIETAARPFHGRPRSALAAAAAVLLGAGSPAPAAAGHHPAAAGGPVKVVSQQALERRHGIRITQVTVTGAGGLVDLRFTVVDEKKASLLLRRGEAPRLVALPSGLSLEAPHHGAMRNVRLKKDAASFVLYPNVRGAVQPGGRLAVAFEGVRVEPVVAK